MCITPKKGLSLRPPEPLSLRSRQQEEIYHAILRTSNQNVENLRQQRKNDFLRLEPEYSDTLDLTQIRCPLHLLRFKQAIKGLVPGQTLKIRSGSPDLIKDLAAACRILNIDSRVLRFRQQHFLYATRSKVHSASVHWIHREPADCPGNRVKVFP